MHHFPACTLYGSQFEGNTIQRKGTVFLFRLHKYIIYIYGRTFHQFSPELLRRVSSLWYIALKYVQEERERWIHIIPFCCRNSHLPRPQMIPFGARWKTNWERRSRWSWQYSWWTFLGSFISTRTFCPYQYQQKSWRFFSSFGLFSSHSAPVSIYSIQSIVEEVLLIFIDY